MYVIDYSCTKLNAGLSIQQFLSIRPPHGQSVSDKSTLVQVMTWFNNHYPNQAIITQTNVEQDLHYMEYVGYLEFRISWSLGIKVWVMMSWWKVIFYVSSHCQYRWCQLEGDLPCEWVGVDNTLSLRQNGCHFADGIFRRIIMNGMFCMSIKIPLKFVPRGSIDNNPALV